jgi:hypothetical protein
LLRFQGVNLQRRVGVNFKRRRGVNFTVFSTQVKGFMYTPPIPKTRSLYDEVQIMMQRLAQIEEAGEDW